MSEEQTTKPEAVRVEVDRALKAWVLSQSAENTVTLYQASLAYFGIKPEIPE